MPSWFRRGWSGSRVGRRTVALSAVLASVALSAAVLTALLASVALAKSPGLEPPDAPQRLQAVEVSHDLVSLSWDDSQDATISGYQILRRLRDHSPVGVFEVLVEDTGSAATEYVDHQVQPETRYNYRVKARNAAGLSPRSNFVRADTPAAPPVAQPEPLAPQAPTAPPPAAGPVLVWTAELTVEVVTEAYPPWSGYSDSSRGNLGALSADSFWLEQREYTVLALFAHGGGLTLATGPPLSHDFSLLVGSTRYESSQSLVPMFNAPGRYWWPDDAIDWADGDQLTVSILLDPDTTAADRALARPTAYLTDVPAAHNGVDPFSLKLIFDTPDLPLTAGLLRDEALQVFGASVLTVERGRNAHTWIITLQPSGAGAITLTLPATTDCAQPDAVCANDGRKLRARIEITIPGSTDTSPSTDSNAVPTSADNTVTTDEDTAYTFAASDFDFTDADSGDALASVEITSLPGLGKGALNLSGTPIAGADLPQTVTEAQLDTGLLTYSPPADENGDDFTTFMFKVNDGTDESASAYTMTINVTAVNTPPTVATSIPDQEATAGTAFSYEFPADTFNDDDGDTLTYTDTKDDDNALPPWLDFDATTRTFSGTPTGTDVGTVTVKVTASDDGGETVSDEFDIVVSASGICGRTAAVQTAILASISGVTDCALVTDAHLAAITGTLNLEDLGITALAAGDFDGLTALEGLDLSGNSLTTLPAGIFDEMTSLTALWLSSNDLTTLPAGVFDELTALTWLHLHDNDLTTLPAGVFDEMTSLIQLNLSENSLTTLPAGIFDEMTSLTMLYLYSNSLTTLPAGMFDELTSLIQLHLGFNSLATLPAGVFDELTALTMLFLDSNSLTTLPAGVFEDLTALTTLRLQDNPGAPFAPVAVAKPDDGTISDAGGMVELIGSGSNGGPWGANVTYSWALTDPASGVTVGYDPDETSPDTTATVSGIPAGVSELTFTLTVTGRAANASNGTAPDTDTATVTRNAVPTSEDFLLPDLVSDPPSFDYGVDSLSVDGQLRRVLRFDGYVTNLGDGPVDLSGNPQLADPSDPTSHDVWQRVKTASGEWSKLAQPPVRFETADGHNHFHLMEILAYSLWSSDGATQVAPGAKVGFCLSDSEPLPHRHPNPGPDTYSVADNQDCMANEPNATSLEMGVTEGWRDSYDEDVAFQWIDVSDVSPGRYRIGVEADPYDVLIESDETNNGVALSDSVSVVSGYVAKPDVFALRPDIPNIRMRLTLRSDRVGNPGKIAFRIVSGPSHGTLSTSGDFTVVQGGTSYDAFTSRKLVYTPDSGFSGVDRFRFIAFDSRNPEFPTRPKAAKVTIDMTGADADVSIVNAPASLVTGTVTSLSASVSGAAPGVSWEVDDVRGGNRTVGTIDVDGTYTAPAVVPASGSVVVRARSTASPSAFAETVITITEPPNTAPAVTPPGDQSYGVGDAVDVHVVAADAQGDLLTWSVDTLPAGLELVASTGRIVGNPTVAGTSQSVVTVSDGELSASATVSWDIWPRSADASLRSLTVDGAVIDPVFDPAQRVYDAQVQAGVARLTVSADATVARATTSIAPPDVDPATAGHQVDLNPAGDTTVSVSVTASDTVTASIYLVVVSQTAAPSVPSSTLNRLHFTDLAEVDFDPDQTRYRLLATPGLTRTTVVTSRTQTGASIDTIAVRAEPGNLEADHDDSDPVSHGRQVDLSPAGDTLIVTRVTSPDETRQNTYLTHITHDDDSSAPGSLTRGRTESASPRWVSTRSPAADAPKLDSLSIAETALDPEFSPDGDSYAATVTSDVEVVTVTAAAGSDIQILVLPADADTVELGHQVALGPPGSVTDIVVVSSADGQLFSYVIKIGRDISTRLSSLSVSGAALDPVFDPSKPDYSATVSHRDAYATIEATAETAAATIGIIPADADPSQQGHQVPLGALGPETVTRVAVITNAPATSANGTYLLTITRPELSPELSSLGIAGLTLTPAFDSAELDYEASAPWDLEAVTVEAVALSPSSTVLSSPADADPVAAGWQISLGPPGPQTVTAIHVAAVAPGNASQTAYTVSINRGEAPPEFFAPSNLAATSYVGGMRLEWDEPGGDAASISGYVIMRRETAPTPTQSAELTTVGANVTEHLDETATAGVAYAYQVKAQRGADTSAASNEATAEHDPTPVTLQSIHVTGHTLIPAFEPEIYDYRLRAPHWATSIPLELQTTLATATYEITSTNDAAIVDDIVDLGSGADIITVTVTHPSGAPTIYTIEVLVPLNVSVSENYWDPLGRIDFPTDITTTGRIKVNDCLCGDRSGGTDADWLAADLEAGKAYRIDVDSPPGWWAGSTTLFGVRDSDGVMIPNTHDDYMGPNYDAQLYFHPEVSGVYYLDVGGTVPYYNLRLTEIDYSNDIAGDSSTTETLAVSTTVDVDGGPVTTVVLAHGEIEFPRDRDWFAVDLYAGVTYSADLMGFSSGLGTLKLLCIFGVRDSNLVKIPDTKTCHGGAQSYPYEDARAFFMPTSTGTHYISAGARWDNHLYFVGTYALSVTEVTDDFSEDTQTLGAVTVGGPGTIGVIEQPGDNDWFAVDLVADTPYRIQQFIRNPAVGGMSDPFVRGVYDANGVFINGTTNSGGLGGDGDGFGQVIFTPDVSGVYFISVGSSRDIWDPASRLGTGSYRLSVKVFEDNCSDDIQTTCVLTVSDTGLVGEIEVKGDKDWFAVELVEGVPYWVHVAGAGRTSITGFTHVNIQLKGIYDSEGSKIPGTTADNGGDDYDAFLNFTPGATGTYYVSINASPWYHNRLGTYRVRVGIADDDYEANKDTTGMIEIGHGVGPVSQTGTIEVFDDEDWFKVLLIPGHVYKFDLEGADTGKGSLEDPLLRALYVSGGSLWIDGLDDNTGTGYNSRYWLRANRADEIYYISVGSSRSRLGTYTLTVTDVTYQ